MDVPQPFVSSFVPLWIGDRGGVPDFLRLGAFAACDAAGTLVGSAGNPDLVAFLRSSAKPFQVLALLRRQLPRQLGLSDTEIACACASHEGEEKHAEAARRILAAANMPEEALLCGTHAPMGQDLQRRVIRGEVANGPIRNNCSGKHAAMLAVCRYEGWPTATYPDAEHPLQRENLATLATFAGLQPEDITVAVDNCTVPTFGLPLRAAARAFARLVDPQGLPPELASAAAAAVRAMTGRPDMVGGEGRLDTAVMERTDGRIVIKTGANGYHAAAGKPASGGPALGFALKLAGAETEVQKAGPVLAALEAVGLLARAEAEDLLARFVGPQRNCRGAVVGGSAFVGTVQRG